MEALKCIVCETEGAQRTAFSRFDCPRCGSFVLSGTAEATIETQLNEKPLRRSLMSHTLRRMPQADTGRRRVISDNELPTFWRDDRLPTPQQQADNLILWIGDNQETPAEYLYLSIRACSLDWPSDFASERFYGMGLAEFSTKGEATL
jgi:hypothetical protein